MNCPKCGAPLEPNTRFCGKCGTIIQSDNTQGQYQQNQYQQNQYQQNPYQQNQYQQNQYQQNQYQQNTYGNQYARGPVKPVSFPQRNLVLCIVLSIVTCGIYGIIWTINLCNDLNEASDNPNGTSGGMLVLLSIVTCGIFMYYWLYKAGDAINKAKSVRGLPTDSNAGIIYLVLAIFGLSIVSYALLQTELNKIAEYHGAPKA